MGRFGWGSFLILIVVILCPLYPLGSVSGDDIDRDPTVTTSATTSLTLTTTTSVRSTTVAATTSAMSSVVVTQTVTKMLTTTLSITSSKDTSEPFVGFVRWITQDPLSLSVVFWVGIVVLVAAFVVRKVTTRRGHVEIQPSIQTVRRASPVDELEDLYNRGILSAEEYLAKRTQLERTTKNDQSSPPGEDGREDPSQSVGEKVKSAEALFADGLLSEESYLKVLEKLQRDKKTTEER